MNQKKIGQFLKELRSEKNLTQEQLANEFAVSSRTVSRWETGSNLPDIATLVELADYYEVDVRELIDGERKSENETDNERDNEEAINVVAIYAKQENEKLYKWIQKISVVGLLAMALAIILQCIEFQANKITIGVLIASVITLITLVIITTYVTGNLEKLIRRKMILVKGIAVVVTAVSVIVIARVMLVGSVIGMLILSVVTTKPEVHNDIQNYQKYVQKEDSDLRIFAGKKLDLLPKEIPNEMKVQDFQYTYYNPWDPQFVLYMTVQYDTEEYEKELERLSKWGVTEYKSYYSVTDEPISYDLVAMRADAYNGFVYAMIPEKNGEKDKNEITYVAILFCNYFLDLDIHKYIPDEYLLKGFDAASGNPYEQEKRKSMGY